MFQNQLLSEADADSGNSPVCKLCLDCCFPLLCTQKRQLAILRPQAFFFLSPSMLFLSHAFPSGLPSWGAEDTSREPSLIPMIPASCPQGISEVNPRVPFTNLGAELSELPATHSGPTNPECLQLHHIKSRTSPRCVLPNICKFLTAWIGSPNRGESPR